MKERRWVKLVPVGISSRKRSARRGALVGVAAGLYDAADAEAPHETD